MLNFRLQHLVFAAFTLVAAIPVAMLALWIQHWSLTQEINAVQEKHLLVARNLTYALSRYTRDVSAVFSHVAMRLASSDEHPDLHDLLDGMQIRHLSILDQNQTTIRELHVDHSVPQGAHTVALAELVKKFRTRAETTPDKVWFSPLVRTAAGEPVIVLFRTLSEQRIAVAVLAMDYVREIQQSIQFGDRGHAAIVDQTGQVIAHPLDAWRQEMKDISFLPPVQAMLRGETGVTTFYTPAMKADMIAGHTQVPEVGWGVMIPQPMQELEARVTEVRRIALGITLVGMAVAAWLGWRLSRRVAHPIMAVAQSARAVANGALRSHVMLGTGIMPSEINDLSQSFNHMVDEIDTKTTAIEASTQRLADAQRIASLGNWEWCPSDGNFWYSAEIARIFGHTDAHVTLTREHLFSQIHSDDQPPVQAASTQALVDGQPYDIEYRVQLPDGRVRYVYQETEPQTGVEGNVATLASTVLDITERKEHEQRLKYQANYDELTGLVNRNAFVRRLNLAVTLATAEEQRLALLYVDLDNFKAINNTLGHSAGDKLLQMAAERLRESVTDNDILSRLGGDEFVVLCDADDADRLIKEITACCNETFALQGYDIFVGCSIGISVFPHDAKESLALLRNANMALAGAKRAGRNTYQYFTAAMSHTIQRQMMIGNALRHALERQEFSVHYQPIVDAITGSICGAEALVRWQHPEMGAISPAEFIPLAEEIGIIGPLGEWVLDSACAQASQWNAQASKPIRVSVNLSTRQLGLGLTAQRISEILNRHALSAELLSLEITETLLLDHADTTVTWLNQVRELGVQFSMDDFGTGYSSLSYLTRIPASTLKLDRTFIRDIETNPDNAALLGAIIALARRMNMKLIAEGVENETQLAFLRAEQCDLIQGYYFSRPVEASAFRKLLRTGVITPVDASRPR